ncbi:hypothetical protein [Candidatus Uabimicrobium sp. HlEnr_7]|uniref:hypothetical protein n=1 Tax=Candidatus Uabimicrobium helgolandensis TaxID=3095367 RepID=UPI0035573BC3
MRTFIFTIILSLFIPFGFASTSYIQCVEGEAKFIAEITEEKGQQFVLASLEIKGESVTAAKIWLNDVPLKRFLSLEFSTEKRSSMQCDLQVYNVHTDKLDSRLFDILVAYKQKIYRFNHVASIPVLTEDTLDNDPDPDPQPSTEPIDIAFEDIRVELGGGIKVIHGKIYDFTQMEYHGIARIRGKTKKYNPFCLFGVGSIDFSGKASVLVYHHSFKGNRYLESTVEVDGYSPLIFIHTGVRYRFAKYASTKTKRILVNKSAGPITNIKLSLRYEIKGQKHSFIKTLPNFEPVVLDLNPYYQLNPVLGRITPPIQETLTKFEVEIPDGREEEKQITILNTSGEEVSNLKIDVSFSSGKGQQNKEVTFELTGEEEVILE